MPDARNANAYTACTERKGTQRERKYLIDRKSAVSITNSASAANTKRISCKLSDSPLVRDA
jgi:hypothetical protein